MNKDFENMVMIMTEVYLTAYQKALEEVRNPQLANQAALNITAILNAQGAFATTPTQDAMTALMAVINAGKQQTKGMVENKEEGEQE